MHAQNVYAYNKKKLYLYYDEINIFILYNFLNKTLYICSEKKEKKSNYYTVKLKNAFTL